MFDFQRKNQYDFGFISADDDTDIEVQQLKRESRQGLWSESLKLLQNTARERRNVFEQLMEAVKYNSLGQISHALYDVGGEYRRNM